MNEQGRRLLDFIQGYMTAVGYPPTLREMQSGMAFRSNNAVRWQLLQLERAGAIQWTRRIARGIKVVNGNGG